MSNTQRRCYSHAQHRTTSLRRQAGRAHEKRPYWMSAKRWQRLIASAQRAACGCQWH